jgi:signal transduction histidine kinase/ligand-binding sensor domain-containing protein
MRRAYCVTSIFAALLFGTGPAVALDPAMRVSQYAHTAWHMQDGVFGGAPHAVTQTADGYIWIGTETGLVRFDGVRSVPWEPPDKKSAISAIYSLLGGRDGTLWIGSAGGLTALKNDRLIDFPNARGRINTIIEDHAGTVWVARSRTRADHAGGICQVAGERLRCFGNSGGMSLPTAGPLVEDRLGNLWIGSSTELLRWSPKSWSAYFREELKSYQGLPGVGVLAVGQDQSIWVGSYSNQLGLRRIVGGVSERAVLPGIDTSKLRVDTLFVDRHNSLWIGTNNDGLYRINGHQLDHFAEQDGLTGNTVENIYEDVEENLWVVTASGLDVFRDIRVATVSTREGLWNDVAASVLAARDGSIWIGNDESLDVLRGNKVTSIRMRDGLPGHRVTSLWEDHNSRIWVGVDRALNIYERGKFRSVPGSDGRPLGIVTAISEDTAGNIWVVAAQAPGQRVFRIADDRVMQEFNESKIPETRALAPDPGGGLWFGVYNGSLAHYRDGKFEIVAKDLGPGGVLSLAVDANGSVWAATRHGLFSWKEGVVKRLGLANGLPCEQIPAVIEGDEGTLWLYSNCGVVSIAAAELDRWWQHPESKIRTRVFDAVDGAQVALSTFLPQASKSPDGRLWFTNSKIIQTVNPRHLNANRLVPPVHVEQVIADRKTYPGGQGLHLPARTRDVEIDYTALSYRVPQKVRFRYKLEGRDTEWQDAGTRRQAFFSDLTPGPYTFRVIARNNDGLWNEAGASIGFSIAPAYYQTEWFRALCAAGIFALIWGAYRLRLNQLRREYSLRVEERVAERTRIARELHDTLLQNFHGLLLRFQGAYNHLPSRPEEARKALAVALDRGAEAITAARDTVQELRSPAPATNELSSAIAALSAELRSAQTEGRPPGVEVEVEGGGRELHPITRDEIYRITTEALRNAFRHAEAERIDVAITHGDREFCITVKDNGKGLDPGILKQGNRNGHWGLQGMRERAEAIGAVLEVWSSNGNGTEVSLRVPATIAYGSSCRLRWFNGASRVAR